MSTPHFNQKLLLQSRVAILGFGAQGTAEAFNLKRSGIPFVLGLRKDGLSWEKAKHEGFKVLEISEAIQQSDTLVMDLPDHVQAAIYKRYIEGQKQVCRLVFAHGFNTHFGLIPVETGGPKHFLVAPKGAATGLREFYGTPFAPPAVLAIRPRMNDEDREWAEAFALALGCHARGLTWADFRDETECDLFSEQALLCGGISSLLRAAFDTMVEGGYSPETAYYESLYELKLIVDLMWKRGITGMREKISPTARYGDVTRGDRVIDESVRLKMKQVLAEIQSGQFTREFLSEYGSENFRIQEKAQAEHPIEQIGKEIRRKLFES